ncbi:MAG: thioredoxin [Bacteroidales bacterium]|nr:thioredoxin [Bacteroidales bacterium]
MKKTLVLLAGSIFLTFQACSSQPDKTLKSDQSSSDSDNNKVVQVVNDKSGAPENILINAPVHLTKADFLEKVMDYEKNATEWIYKGNLPCLIDFYADWCAPCRITGPILAELAHEYAGKVIIYKIDVQKERELASVFGIQSIPAFLFCPLKGNPSMSAGIASSPEETKNMFRQQIESILLGTTSGSQSL